MVRFREGDIAMVFNKLYDSEINFQLYTFWDSGYEIKIGDPINGFKDLKPFHPDTNIPQGLSGAISMLACYAATSYPESDFTKWYLEWEAFQEKCDAVANGEAIFTCFNPTGGGVLEFTKTN